MDLNRFASDEEEDARSPVNRNRLLITHISTHTAPLPFAAPQIHGKKWQ